VPGAVLTNPAPGVYLLTIHLDNLS
jgi:hypothetical protein